ncbi:MAG: alpha/beta fold hydrolase [Myxococcaceae bacterium]|nr:alpha/beta fold hydrolase [Myxococcaceae bacterium]
MQAAVFAAPKNSTTVRFRFLEWLAPKALIDRAYTAWCTPPRAKKPRPPKDGRAFELETPLGTLKAWEWGMRDDGETVLLVHGWGGSAVTMEKLAKPLADAGKQVIAIDLPAHGLSPGRITNAVEMSRAIEAALWRFRPSAVIAHSLGASATALALTRGPKVERAVLLAPGVDLSYFAHAFAARAGLSQGVALGILSRIQERVGVSVDSLALWNNAPPEATNVLVVHDPADTEIPWSQVQELQAAWPKMGLLAAPGVGHFRLPRDAAAISAAVGFVVDGQRRGTDIRVLSSAA